MDAFLTLPTDIAVVPIVAAAGSAILPTLAAAGATLIGLLLKPKELVAACKRKPHVPVLIVVGILAVWAGIHLFTAKGAGEGRRRNTGTAQVLAAGQTDWTRVALEIIQQQKTGAVFQPLETAPVDRTQDTGRRRWDRGPSPQGLSKVWN